MIYNIQILRAIAALMVVAFHTVGTSEKYSLSTDFFYKVDVWGPSGVDIFFVISGFIMVYIQCKKQRSSIQFLIDRVERIVPLYWFLTLSLAILVLLLPSAFNSREFNLGFLLDSLFFINFISDVEPIVYVGWTLEYEMLFYLVFGLSLIIKKENISFLITGFVLLFLVWIGVDSIVFEFIYGMIIGYFFNRLKFLSGKNIYTIFIVAGFSLLAIDWGSDLPRSIKWGLPAVLVFLGFLFIKPIESIFLRKIGDASYSIYLVQVFTIPVFYKIIDKISFQFSYMSEIYIILCIAFTAIVGFLLYLLFEKPVTHIIKYLKTNLKTQKVL